MIQTGRSVCVPSPATVQELFSAARDANVIPDISLDPILTTFLSLDSHEALQHQYTFLQRDMSVEQQETFTRNLTAALGSSRVSYGGVGVVALALSILFDQVAKQVRSQGVSEGLQSTQRLKAKNIFGISVTSRIGLIIHSYLDLIPGVANNQEEMAETTELYDNWLKRELLDYFERMTTKKRMSTNAMQQWLTGTAFHLHMRIHQVRLQSVPLGSVESLCLSYKTGLNHLMKKYNSYLRANVQETAAPPPQKPEKKASTSSSSKNTPNLCLTDYSSEVFSMNETERSRRCTTQKKVNSSDLIEMSVSRNDTWQNTTDSPDGCEQRHGLLVIEPQRNISHSVHHHPCESMAIQQNLVMLIMNAQDVEPNRNFFMLPKKLLQSLLRQSESFDLGNE